MNRFAAKPVVFARFLEPDILGEQGRLLFSVLNAFAVSGYPIELSDTIPHERLGRYGIGAHSIAGLSLTKDAPKTTSEKIYLFDKEDRSIGQLQWFKKLHVKFDIFSPYWFQRPIVLPFPLHPVHTGPDLRDRLSLYRISGRNIRVSFSGELEGYTRSRIQYPRPKLPRAEIINAVLQRLRDKALFVQHQDVLDSLFTTSHLAQCVIIDTSRLRVSDKDWLAFLGRSDFFLAPPGIVMPMCHNIVEAMAVGAIPITNYPEWFDPPLKHLHNCLAFDDEDDLIEKLRLALSLDYSAIDRMRERTVAYYDTHLTSESFTAQIESCDEHRIAILIMTERYVGSNAGRLNANSVLVRGGAQAGRFRWLGRLMRR